MGACPSSYSEEELKELKHQQNCSKTACLLEACPSGGYSDLPGCNSLAPICLGTSLSELEDPLKSRRGKMSRTHCVFDVDGNGKIELNDLHDALFLAYPVEHPPLPDHSPEAMKTMLDRHRQVCQEEFEEENQEFLRSKVNQPVPSKATHLRAANCLDCPQPPNEFRPDEFQMNASFSTDAGDTPRTGDTTSTDTGGTNFSIVNISPATEPKRLVVQGEST